jgi:hypothetical protein
MDVYNWVGDLWTQEGYLNTYDLLSSKCFGKSHSQWVLYTIHPLRCNPCASWKLPSPLSTASATSTHSPCTLTALCPFLGKACTMNQNYPLTTPDYQSWQYESLARGWNQTFRNVHLCLPSTPLLCNGAPLVRSQHAHPLPSNLEVVVPYEVFP